MVEGLDHLPVFLLGMIRETVHWLATGPGRVFQIQVQALESTQSSFTLQCLEDFLQVVQVNEPELEVWPSPEKAKEVISKFKEKPKLEQNKRMLNQETLLKKRIQKAEDQLKKQRDENRQKEMRNLMFKFLSTGGISDNNVSLIDLSDLSRLIDQTIKEINLKIEKTQGQDEVEETQTKP
ncbi:hypothetical protein PIB30_025015 [Stylosanthes scabra]|uniref:Uncharacterized protein n=1 Tax=Stylosanthes scabra TaxID=79078 RepID=A0ABU6Q9F1_9FABA|nr:hypothetical protein [Stylosanthes scabra]